MAEAAHSKIGASSMYRWSVCPGSVRESSKVGAKQASVYAEEGSDAHALGAFCLRERKSPFLFIDVKLHLEGRTFTPDEGMAEAVQVYIDAVRDEIQSDQDVLTVEQRFDLSAVHPGCFGTADAVIWQPHSKTLIVIDYKHGAGIPVKVEGNPQLQYYGLGALLASGYPAASVKLVIVQPRCDHADGPVRSWEIDGIDLLDFRADLKRYAMATEAPDAPLVPGDHCRFCPAASQCSVLEQRALTVAQAEFAPATAYDAVKLSEALVACDLLEARVKAIREFAYAEAEAGRFPPGWKLVAKYPRRKWKDEQAVIDAFPALPDEAFKPRKLVTPAELEKLIGKAGLGDYIVAESSGHALVPESDKRPAVTRATPQEEFEAVGGDPLTIPSFLDRRNEVDVFA